MKFNIAIVTPILLTTALLGCSSKPMSGSEQQGYAKASTLIENEKYQQAITRLEWLDQNHPFGNYADQVQLDLIYTNFKTRQFAEVIRLADRMIRLQPGHPEIAYAWYMKAVGNHELSRSGRSFVTGWKIIGRDPSKSVQAFQMFDSYLEQFPDHKYAADARARQMDIRNRMADYDLETASYYAERDLWVAAIKRAQKVITDYPGAPANRKALNIMKSGYLAIGEPAMAEQIDNIISNLPG